MSEGAGPERRVNPALDAPTVARRQRRFALPTGLVLAVCIFLPTVRVCGSPTYPISMPPFWTPYLLGIGVAILGGARTLRGVRTGQIFVEVVMAISCLGWGVAALFGGREGVMAAIVIGSIGAAFFRIARWGTREERAAHLTIFCGLLCTPWFALWAFDADGMFGAWVSLCASIAIFFAGLEWRRELRNKRVDPVPRAAVVR